MEGTSEELAVHVVEVGVGSQSVVLALELADDQSLYDEEEVVVRDSVTSIVLVTLTEVEVVVMDSVTSNVLVTLLDDVVSSSQSHSQLLLLTEEDVAEVSSVGVEDRLEVLSKDQELDELE